MTWDNQRRRIVEHETLLSYFRRTLERDKRNRGERIETHLYAEDLL